ncbi:MAG: dihydrolipoamide acetyltransferase family protein, partial [Candidatus Limnocylindria bacterium]
VRATPAVRRLATEHGIDLSQVKGTGLNGRVSRKDVEEAVARGPEAPRAAAAPSKYAPIDGDRPIALTQMRRAIADNMVRAWSAPHAHAVMEIDMTALMRYRDQVKADFAAREGFDLSPAAFIVKAAVEALRQVPLVNAGWTDQGIVVHGAINVGYAVALGDEGLVVPVIKGADGMSLAGLMRAIRDVVDRAKTKKLTFDDFSGGTFTVNNTGPLGTIVSSPIVPPGQAAIISSETIAKRVVVLDDDSIAIRQRMNLVIGFDHRVIDGATAARFLQTMRDWLQSVGPSAPIY